MPRVNLVFAAAQLTQCTGSAARGSGMERRGGNRIGTRAALEARTGGRTFPVQLYDLSPTGCQIDCSTAYLLSRGDRIVIRFSEEISLSGKITRRRGASAGVQFSSPLPEAIARHLNF